ncbi:MAG: orotidine-5'-phosphate decarboxylase [Bacillota bacterium]|nr:orotidine-5'-phosphate decarboxylase [Bacillota bacterium]
MIDRLLERIDALDNPTVVGLDPTWEMLPRGLREEQLAAWGKTPEAAARGFLAYNKIIIDSVADLVPAVKPQIAMYEKYGLEGLRAYVETVAYAKEKGLLVIGDIKRGDVASTAAAYAAHIGGVEIEGAFFDPWQEDAVTLNPYLGRDGIEPFLRPCREKDKGLFILVRTSNPGSGELQDLLLADREEEASGEPEPVYCRVGRLVSSWGLEAMGSRGYSRIGAVVGATHREQGERLRAMMPHTFFLVPGYGAQGASGRDLKGFFDREGRGCIVNSSRGITAAYQKDPRFGQDGGAAAREAVLAMRADLKEARR